MIFVAGIIMHEAIELLQLAILLLGLQAGAEVWR